MSHPLEMFRQTRHRYFYCCEKQINKGFSSKTNDKEEVKEMETQADPLLDIWALKQLCPQECHKRHTHR